MPGITSKWSAVQDTIRGLVAAAVTPTRVDVSTPHPDLLTKAGVRVWLPTSDQDTHTQAWALSDQSAKVEAWDQDIVVFGTTLTTEGSDARDRVDAMVHPILAALAADPTLGGLVMMAQVTKVAREEGLGDGDRAVRQHAARITVHVDAWLGPA